MGWWVGPWLGGWVDSWAGWQAPLHPYTPHVRGAPTGSSDSQLLVSQYDTQQQAVAPADEVAAHVGSGAAVHVDGRPIAPAPAGAGAGAGAGHNRGHGHGHGSNSSSSSSGCSNGAGGNGGGCSSAAGGGGGGGGGAGDSYFERELEHITSGRFVAEVDSPVGVAAGQWGSSVNSV